MSVNTVMAQALAGLRLCGLKAPFGTIPEGPEQIAIQVRCYIEAIQDRNNKPAEVEFIEKTAKYFRAKGGDFPSSAEFADEYATQLYKEFLTLGVGFDAEGRLETITVRRSLPQAEIEALLCDAQKKLPEIPKSLTSSKSTSKDASRAGSDVVRKFTGAETRASISDEDQAAFEAARSQQIKALAESSVNQENEVDEVKA